MVFTNYNAIQQQGGVRYAHEKIMDTSTNTEEIILTRDLRQYDISTIIPILASANNVTLTVQVSYEEEPGMDDWYDFDVKDINNASSFDDRRTVIRPYDTAVSHVRLKLKSTTAGSHADVIIHGKYFYVQS